MCILAWVQVRKQRSARKQAAAAAITLAAPVPAPAAAASAQPDLQKLLSDTAAQGQAAVAVAQASLLSSVQHLQASLAPGARQLQSSAAVLTVPQVAGITVVAVLALMMLKGIMAGGSSSSGSSSAAAVVQKTTSPRVTAEVKVIEASSVKLSSLPQVATTTGAVLPASEQHPASAAPTKPLAPSRHVTNLDSGMLALIALAGAAIDGATKPGVKLSGSSAAGVPKKAAPFTASGPKADPNMLALLAVAGVTLDGVTPVAKLLASNLSSNGKAAAVTGSGELLLSVEGGMKWAQATSAEASAQAAAVSSELVSTSGQIVNQLSQVRS